MYLVCHLCYTVLFVGLGQANNISTVIILRFLQGAFGSTGSTMVGGTISDIWSSKERGQPMALFATVRSSVQALDPSGPVGGTTKISWVEMD